MARIPANPDHVSHLLSPVQLRLVALGTLVLGATAIVGWSAHATWRRFGELHEGLQLAQRFEENVITLHTQLNQLAAGNEAADLRILVETSREVAAWVEAEKRDTHTARQDRMLGRIAGLFGAYLRSVEQLAANPSASDAERLKKTIALEEQLAVILRESPAADPCCGPPSRIHARASRPRSRPM